MFNKKGEDATPHAQKLGFQYRMAPPVVSWFKFITPSTVNIVIRCYKYHTPTCYYSYNML